MPAKRKLSAAQKAAEIRSLDLLPQAEALRRTDNLLRTMLNSPPAPFTPKAKPKKRAKK